MTERSPFQIGKRQKERVLDSNLSRPKIIIFIIHVAERSPFQTGKRHKDRVLDSNLSRPKIIIFVIKIYLFQLFCFGDKISLFKKLSNNTNKLLLTPLKYLSI